MSARLLTIEQAAERLNVTERWLRRAVFEQRIPYVKLGRLVRFAEDDLDAFIAERHQPAREAPSPVPGVRGSGTRRLRRIARVL